MIANKYTVFVGRACSFFYEVNSKVYVVLTSDQSVKAAHWVDHSSVYPS